SQEKNETIIMRSMMPITIGKHHLISVQLFPHFIVLYLDKNLVDMKVKKETFTAKSDSVRISIGAVPKSFQKVIMITLLMTLMR
ncbi:hypothetical protein CEXT_799401, partial [Caerostris extrusa]